MVRTHFMNFFVPRNDIYKTLADRVEHFLKYIEEEINGTVIKCEATDSEHAYIVYQVNV